MKSMRRQWLQIILALFLPLAAKAANSTNLAAARNLVEAEWKNLKTPGLSIAIAVDDQLAWAAGFGLADLEKKTPATSNTVYRIASISKPIAATAVIQLAERGQVLLGDPIQKYVPTFPLKPEGTVTIRHLLTHTSGIRHYQGIEVLSNKRYHSVAESITIFKDDPLQFVPGTKFQYSSYGYNLLAGVVEQSSGKDFRTYLKTRIFQPAGMMDSDLEFLEIPNPRRASQYIRNKTGDGFVPAPPVDLSYKWAGGGISSTAVDLIRFHNALNKGLLLKPNSRSQMLQPTLLAGNTNSNYGLGWRVDTDKQGRTWVHHSGGATGGTTFLRRNIKDHIAVAVLCNAQSVEGLSDFTLRISETLLKDPTPPAQPK